jgi:hypothetical protein
MNLKTQTIKELKNIIEKDYGIPINDDDAEELGCSLLKLTRLSITALARADEKNKLASSGKNNQVLEPNTSE